MTIRIGINGFGRIGRVALRMAQTRKNVEIVGINDVAPTATLAHLFQFDSVHRRYPGTVEHEDNALIVDGRKIKITCEKDPTKLPWKELKVDLVLECTGKFTDRAGAAQHLTAGAKKVIISAPGKGDDGTFVIGVNHQNYDPTKHHVVSNASCTTNCLAPIAWVLHKNFEIERGFMTTIHSYTNDQEILDAPHKDLRRARAGAQNQIPTTTGAAKAVGLVLPELAGKLDGLAIRVPTPNVSCVDLVCTVKKPATVEAVNNAFKEAAKGSLKNILAFEAKELVSSDFMGDVHSATVDGPSTKVIGNLVKVIGWYDNEIGFTARLLDLSEWIGDRLQ